MAFSCFANVYPARSRGYSREMATPAFSKFHALLRPLAIAFPVLGGCEAARLAPPADVAQNADRIDATNRSGASGLLVNESFDLVPFKVTDVDRSFTTSESLRAGAISNTFDAGGFAYKFAGSGAPMDASCRFTGTRRPRTGPAMVGFQTDAKEAVECTCGAGTLVALESTPTELTFSFGAEPPTRLAGRVLLGSDAYKIRSLHTYEGGGSSASIAGYRVDNEGPVAAVDVMNPGRLWLTKGMSESDRERMTCLFAGLMLYQPANGR
jgi:hypothetical protein